MKGEQAPRATRGLGGNYWKLLGDNVLGNLGDGVTVVALPWYASTLTHDPLAITVGGKALVLTGFALLVALKVADVATVLLGALTGGDPRRRVHRRNRRAAVVPASRFGA